MIGGRSKLTAVKSRKSSKRKESEEMEQLTKSYKPQKSKETTNTNSIKTRNTRLSAKRLAPAGRAEANDQIKSMSVMRLSDLCFY